MRQKIDSLALGYAAAIISALLMLLLGIAANLGIYVSAAESMQQWHVFFTFSLGGIIFGMIEAAIVSFILIYLFGWFYNKLAK